ncbi:MAG: N-acetylmuramoyl-L-alanine amidase [Sulfitobacter sp.]
MFSIRSLSGGDFLYQGGSRVEYKISPHQRDSNPVDQTPRLLVMHYTGGSRASGSIDWFANPISKVSAHITIGRDGKVYQSVAFDKRAWHCGHSSYRAPDGTKVTSINAYSIGIELANAGACLRTAGGSWKNGLGVRVSSDDIIEARHKNGSVYFGSNPHGVPTGNVTKPGWETYPEAQLVAARELAGLLVEHYGLQDIVGHDDISPGRKSDPGPLFDTVGFRDSVFGMDAEGAAAWEVRPGTPGGLSIRVGPAKEFDKVREENLAVGTVVELNEMDGRWWHVTVLDDNGDDLLDGWVHSRYLQRHSG